MLTESQKFVTVPAVYRLDIPFLEKTHVPDEYESGAFLVCEHFV
jgi:hypothetical protein